MGKHVPLPEALRTSSFSIEAARAAGLGRGRLDGDDLGRPFYGVRAAVPAHPAALYAPRLRPGDRFSHTTAAGLWGAPLPASIEADVHVTAGAGLVRPRAAGVFGHLSSVSDIVMRAGLPVSSPATAFIESARVLGLDALVAVGDHLVLDPRHLDPVDLRPYVSHADLLSALRRASGRGVVRARTAGGLVRPGVESPMETRLRLLLVRAGIPEPVCGYPVRTREGRHIGHFDLAWPEQRVLAEYDGDQHRTSTEQYDRDIRRYDLASDAGWRVIRVRMKDFRAPTHTISRVARALHT